jgi:hypothetical protein
MLFECPDCLESGSISVNGSSADLDIEFCPFCGCPLDADCDDDDDYEDEEDSWTEEDEAALEDELTEDDDDDED